MINLTVTDLIYWKLKMSNVNKQLTYHLNHGQVLWGDISIPSRVVMSQTIRRLQYSVHCINVNYIGSTPHPIYELLSCKNILYHLIINRNHLNITKQTYPRILSEVKKKIKRLCIIQHNYCITVTRNGREYI